MRQLTDAENVALAVVATEETEETEVERHCRMAGYHLEATLPHLQAFARPICPTRPTEFETDDYSLAERLRAARGSDGKKKEDRDLLAAFGRWRGKVLFAEMRGSGLLLHLLRVADHFSRAGLLDEMYQVVIFACGEYQFYISSPPADDKERRRLAARHSRRLDVLSDVLLMDGYREPDRSQDRDRVEHIKIDTKELFR